MSFRIFRHICTTQHFSARTLVSAVEPLSVAPKVAVRAPDNNPVNHTVNDIAKIYTIPDAVVNKLFAFQGLPKLFTTNAKTFAEHSVLIRGPAIELIDCLKKADYNRPVIRYVLYGKVGSGKSITMAHVLHYAHASGFIIVHIPWVWNWFGSSKEVVTSIQDPSLIDLPLDAASWLKRFDTTNSDLLTRLDLRVTKDFVWNQREKTPKDSPLTEMVNYGINRVKYAPAVVDAVVNELKHFSRQGSCKTLVAIDGYNGFFAPSSRLRTEQKIFMIPSNVTLTRTFLSAVKADWNNGAVIVTVDRRSGRGGKFLINNSDQPVALLGKQGIESLDPFVPILVPQLTEAEFHSLLDFYEEKRWLQTPNARTELEFITQRNPKELITLCSHL